MQYEQPQNKDPETATFRARETSDKFVVLDAIQDYVNSLGARRFVAIHRARKIVYTEGSIPNQAVPLSGIRTSTISSKLACSSMTALERLTTHD